MSIIKNGDKTYVYPIDECCKYKGEILVVNNCAYTCTLNQTDIEANKNKFYIMQIIKISDSKYIWYTKYGRISELGKSDHKEFSTSSSVIMAFEKQFKSKTGNNWSARDNFITKEGKYFMAKITYEIKDPLPEIPKTLDIKSKLDDRVQNLMRLLTDVDTMNKALIQLEIDPKKMPLGKISNEQLDKAKDLLSSITDVLDRLVSKTSDDKKKQTSINSTDDKELVTLSSKFYTYIPYSCGRKKPPIIDCKEQLDNYNNMIEELRNLAVAVKITDAIKNNTDKHPCDVVYEGLNTNIQAVNKKSAIWKYLTDYVHNTHASTHNYRTEVLDIYQISRQGEFDNFDKHSRNISNHTLLFHGSRITNFCSILNKGLLLNPANLGVYITGKMYGLKKNLAQ